ncbi:MAG: C1 family peptidase [Candidatus Eisenbacteria bacterium]
MGAKPALPGVSHLAWPASLLVLAALVTVACAAGWAAEETPHGQGLILPEFKVPYCEIRMPRSLAPLPAHFDWREQGKVSPVKDQGKCGACYAFASIGNIESKMLREGAGSFDFSENNIKECSPYGAKCRGGNYWIVANYLSRGGAVLEACDPYVEAVAGCKTDCPSVKTLLDWRAISEDSLPPTNVLKAYLMTYGPLFIGINAGHGDAWYSEFLNYDGSYTLHYTDHVGYRDLNHAVLLVGWDDNLIHSGGQGGWIVKNSYGALWGGPCGYGDEGGYFTIAYGSAGIGRTSSFIYESQDFDPDGRLFFYDEAGYFKGFGYHSTEGWAMCKFVPAEDVVLQRVEFWSVDAIPDADVYIYDDIDGMTPTNLIASQLDYAVELRGYHSISLDSRPVVHAGDDVYVAVKITAASDTVPIPVDALGPKVQHVCYTSPDGITWYEFTAGDLAIRLRATLDNDGTPPEISISAKQDPIATSELEVSVDISEAIIDASLLLTIGADTLEMQRIATPGYKYRGTYEIKGSGVAEIAASARDLVDNLGVNAILS